MSARVEVAERLRTAIGRLTRTLRLTHIDSNLSPSQREVLFAITARGPLGLSQLAAEEGINPTMLSRIVTNLETATLVTRTSNGTDARVVQVTSTDAGRALCDEIRNERTEALLFALGKLTAEKRRVLLETLPVLEEIVETLRSRDR